MSWKMGFPRLTSLCWFGMPIENWVVHLSISLWLRLASSSNHLHNLVGCFSLAVALRVSKCGVPIPYSKLTAVSSKSFAIKLKAIDRDEGVKDTETCDYISSHEVLDVLILDVGEGLCFHPFRDVVGSHNEPPLVPRDLQKWPNYF